MSVLLQNVDVSVGGPLTSVKRVAIFTFFYISILLFLFSENPKLSVLLSCLKKCNGKFGQLESDWPARLAIVKKCVRHLSSMTSLE